MFKRYYLLPHHLFLLQQLLSLRQWTPVIPLRADPMLSAEVKACANVSQSTVATPTKLVGQSVCSTLSVHVTRPVCATSAVTPAPALAARTLSVTLSTTSLSVPVHKVSPGTHSPAAGSCHQVSVPCLSSVSNIIEKSALEET